jgi:hypothetical protein
MGWFFRRTRPEPDQVLAALRAENEQLRAKLEGLSAPEIVGTMFSGMAAVFKAMSEAEVARLAATVEDRQEERKMAEAARQARRDSARDAREKLAAQRRTGKQGDCKVCANPSDPSLTTSDIAFHYNQHALGPPLTPPRNGGKGA